MPTNEPYVPFDDPSINPLIKKGNDIVKRFVSPATTVSGGGNGVTSLDDPTYLGFSLWFDITSPLFNGATNGDPAKPPSETPFFDALGEKATELVRGKGGEGDNDTNEKVQPLKYSGPSAKGYLDEVGDVTRASYLQMFVQGLREVNTYRPYYWQTIGGIQEAWEKTLDFEDPFIGSKDAEGITIGCLEAIDLKISALFNLYKAAIYDVKYRRMVIPKNLMYFDVYVDVYEIRNFKSTKTWLNKLTKNEPTDVDKFLNNNTSKITFKFSDCLWVPAESGKVFENVTNAGGNEMAATSMKWQYGSVSIESDFAGIDQMLSDSARKQDKGGLGGAIKNAAKAQAQKAANAVLNRAEGAIRAGIGGLVLGNAFGLRNQIIGAIQNPGALASAIEGALVPSRRGGGPDGPSLGDNPLGEGLQPSNSLPSENINLGRIPQPNAPLGSSNVFGPGPSGPPPLNSNNVFG